MKSTRLEALSDAIFAIVMTLLVLELHVPVIEQANTLLNHELATQLSALWPKFLSFVISFIVLAIYWNGHHIQFNFIRRINLNFVWLNMVLLLFISAIPFTTALIGEYPFEQISIVIYASNLIICGLLLYGVWSYANKHDLVESESISAELRRNAKNKMLIPPVVYGLAIVISFVNIPFSLILLALGPIIYFLPVDSKTWRLITGTKKA